MAGSQETTSLYMIEIQSLKEQLDASHKKVDRYAHLIATLSDELDNLRANICLACKKKFIPVVPGNVLAPPAVVAPPSSSLDSSPAASRTTSVWRHMFQRRRRQSRSHSPVDNTAGISSNLPAMPSPFPEVLVPIALPELSTSVTTVTDITMASEPSDSNRRTTTPELPEWSVIFNPDVKRTLDLRIADVFTYETPVFCAKMSPDGRRLAIGLEEDEKIYINGVQTGSNIHVSVDLATEKGALSIWSVQFSPDGRLLAIAASDNRVRIWDIAQKRMRASFKGHTTMINSIAFSPNGRSLVTASDDGSVLLWNARDGSCRKVTQTNQFFLSAEFSLDGRYIAASNTSSVLSIWDARTLKLLANWTGHSDSVWCVKFTPDGKGLMSGGSDRTLKYWDVSSLGIDQVTSGRESVIPPEIRSFAGHTNTIRYIAFFPGNSEWVLTCSNDRSVRLWNIRTGVWQLTLQGHTDRVRVVDFSSTENVLASASKDGRVALWRYEVL